MASIASTSFWAASAERALKTTCQVAVSLLAVGTTGILDVDWLNVLSVSALAGVVSVLTSVASAASTDGSPSLASEHLTDDVIA